MGKYNFMTKQQTKNKNLWENLHKQQRFRPKYPHEKVIQFVYGNFPRDKAKEFKILDHGCGSGRHLFFLAENEYSAYGCDCSEDGINFTKKILTEKELSADLKIITDDYLKYPDEYFDGIISFGVLYYLDSMQLEKVIPEFHRILKKDGKTLLILRSEKDYRFKHAKDIGNGDFLIMGDKKTRVNNEKNMLMHFFTKNEILERFKIFKKINIDEMYCSYNNEEFFDHDYVVELLK